MRTIFETSWQRDIWSPRMGQSFFDFKWLPSFFDTAGNITSGYFKEEAAEEARRAAEIQKQTLELQRRTLQEQQAAPEKILGVSPGTALIVGGLGIAAVIGIVMLVKSK